MKQSQSNPLLKELAKATSAGPHPDADLLTAFAEGTLLQREKQEVLEHLAACADCREVIAIAASTPTVIGPAAVRLRPARRPIRIWLPWAGIATALLVVSTSILLYQQRAAHQSSTVAKDTITQAPPLMTAPPAQPMSAADQQTQARRDELDRRAKKAPSAAAAPPVPAVAIPQSEGSVRVETGKEPSQQAQTNDALQNQLAASPDARNQQQALGEGGNGMRQARNEKDLQSNQAMSQSAANQAQAPTTVQGNSAAFVQLEPQREMAKAEAGIAGVARPHWHINVAGQPERSYGNGIWQPVLPQESTRMRVISVFGNQVWIGGDHTRLYRSTDDGSVWTLVALPEKNGTDHSIVHIRFEAPGTITIEASDGLTWTSHDHGATWK